MKSRLAKKILRQRPGWGKGGSTYWTMRWYYYEIKVDYPHIGFRDHRISKAKTIARRQFRRLCNGTRKKTK